MFFSSRRAKRAGWSKGLKAPEGSFRSFGPAGVLRRRLLHRNGTFVPPAQWTRTRQGWKRILGEKRAVAGPFMNQSEKARQLKRPEFSCRRSCWFNIFCRWPETGRFSHFRALGGQYGCPTFWGSPRRSIASVDQSAPIHGKKDFCGGDGYFGQKKLAEKVRKSRQNLA